MPSTTPTRAERRRARLERSKADRHRRRESRPRPAATERYRQLHRLFALCGVMHRSRWTDLEAAEIHDRLGGATGDPCDPRTTQRDLQFLETIGAVNVTRSRPGSCIPHRYRWAGQPLAALFAPTMTAGGVH